MNTIATNRAVFLDRDGVVNAMVYHGEHGITDSPFTAEQLELLPHACEAIRRFHEMGYLVTLVSNQPAIAKGHMSQQTFEEIVQKMKVELDKGKAFIDAEYYCFHHPEAKVDGLKTICECRKPKPGLLLQAAKDMDIDLSQSFMIGDGLTDIRAGKDAGTNTILFGRMKCELCHQMDEEDARPDVICSNLSEAITIVRNAV